MKQLKKRKCFQRKTKLKSILKRNEFLFYNILKNRYRNTNTIRIGTQTQEFWEEISFERLFSEFVIIIEKLINK